MKNMMLRLVEDGKIVGYEKHDVELGTIRIFQNISLEAGWTDVCIFPFTRYDSCDIGIKVGDVQWFVGDIGDHSVYGEFTLRWDDEEDICYLALKSGGRANHAKYELAISKCIGNIYDNKEPND